MDKSLATANATAASGKKTVVALNGMELITMDNNELIQQARGLCENAQWKNKWDRGMTNEEFGSGSRTLVPQLCDALEALTARAEKAAAERDTYRAALEALHISTDLLKGE